jgi:hypothetical protein
MNKRMAWVVVALFAALGAASARAADVVDLALVLAVDVSRSIDNEEYKLQREGYARAFSDPRVVSAIRSGSNRRIAVTFVEWSSSDQQRVAVDWMVVGDEESAAVFSAAILNIDRSFLDRTSISAGIDFSVQQFQRAGVITDRRTIDVSGDGVNNSGRPVTAARDDALRQGITINGLAIVNDNPNPFPFFQGGYGGYGGFNQPPEGLAEYFRQNVIGGPGSFMMVAEDFQSFAFAIANKLIREIAEAPPEMLQTGE